MKKLLQKFRNNWLNLATKNEVSLFVKFAKKGRSLIISYSRKVIIERNYVKYSDSQKIFSVILIVPFTIYMTKPLIPKLLDVIYPLNESRFSETLLKVDYLVDHNKYFWPIYFHNLQIFNALFMNIAVDSYFVMIVHNSISMFAVSR